MILSPEMKTHRHAFRFPLSEKTTGTKRYRLFYVAELLQVDTMHLPYGKCTAWFCLLLLKPDGQGIHTQNVLILNVLGQGEYHADANVLCDIFRINDLSTFGRIEGDAVILDRESYTLQCRR